MEKDYMEIGLTCDMLDRLGITSIGKVVIPEGLETDDTIYKFTELEPLYNEWYDDIYDDYLYEVIGLFENCKELISAVIPDCIETIGAYAFKNCTGLTNIKIGNGVTKINGEAFYNCTGLTSITIPNGVTYIGSNAFEKCSGLTSIEFPKSIQKIDFSAFKDCTNLREIILNSSIGLSAIDLKNIFENCPSLKNIKYCGLNIEIDTIENIYENKKIDTIFKLNRISVKDNGILYTNSENEIISDFINYQDKKIGFIIPNDVKKIENLTFARCKNLTNIKIPNSVSDIGMWAFVDCSDLTDIEIPKNVTKIKKGTFYGCISLTNITFPSNISRIEFEAFGHCTSLTSITIPNNVSHIDHGAFKGCTSLTEVIWSSPMRLTKVDIDYIFAECPNLESINYHGKRIELKSANLDEVINNAHIPTQDEPIPSLDDIIKTAGEEI